MIDEVKAGDEEKARIGAEAVADKEDKAKQEHSLKQFGQEALAELSLFILIPYGIYYLFSGKFYKEIKRRNYPSIIIFAIFGAVAALCFLMLQLLPNAWDARGTFFNLLWLISGVVVIVFVNLFFHMIVLRIRWQRKKQAEARLLKAKTTIYKPMGDR